MNWRNGRACNWVWLLFLAGLCSPGTSLGQGVAYDDIRNELFDALNTWRRENGTSAAERAPLTRDQILDEIIQLHVEDKTVCGFRDAHTSCDGRNLNQRVNGQDSSGNRVSGAPNYVEGQSGRIGWGENMAIGLFRAADRELEIDQLRAIIRDDTIRQLPGIGEAQIQSLVNSRFEDLQTASGCVSYQTQDGNRHQVCRMGSGSQTRYIEPGFIGAWSRSPGHRRNMLGAWGAVGIGYDEVNDASPISGQLFGLQVKMSGFYAAVGMSDNFLLTTTPLPAPPPDPPPGGGPMPPPTGPMPPPVVEMPGSPGGPGGDAPTTETPTLPVMSANERALARSFLELSTATLDEFNLAEGDTEALIRVVDEFSRLPTVEDMVDILGQLAPATNELITDAGPLLDMSVSNMVGRRMTALRLPVSRSSSDSPARQRLGAITIRNSGHLPATASPHIQLAAASTQDDSLIGLLGVMGAKIESNLLNSDSNKAYTRSGFWSQVYAGRGERDPDGLYTGYDQQQYTVFAGIDWPVGNQVLVGLLAGVGKSDVDFDSAGGKTDIYHYLSSLYASLFNASRSAYLNATLSAGYIEYEQRRRIRIGNEIQYAEGDGHSWILGGSLSGGLLFNVNGMQIEPELAIHYNNQRVADFDETGSALRLNVDERRTDTLIFSAGLNFAGQIDTGHGTIALSLGAHYLREDPLDSRNISAAYAVAPSRPEFGFELTGRSDARHYYRTGLGLVWQVRRHFYMQGDYQHITGSELEDHLFGFGMRYDFL